MTHFGPRELPGDRGYGFACLIAAAVLYGIRSLLSPRGKDVPHGSGLGEKRYVVERKTCWLGRFRRISQCDERKGAHFRAFNELGACIVRV